MDIIHRPPGADIPHDPLVCGILRETSCPACAAAFDPTPPAPSSLWERLLQCFPLLRRLTEADRHVYRSPPPPRPDDGFLLQLTAQLADNDRRGIIVAALASDMATIARAAVRGGAE
jgi:hypothetical protein